MTDSSCLVPAAVPWTLSDSPWVAGARPCHPAQLCLQQLRSWLPHSRWCCSPIMWLACQLIALASVPCQSQVRLGRVGLVESPFSRLMPQVLHHYRNKAKRKPLRCAPI